MATLLHLAQHGALTWLDPGLDPGERRYREIFVLPRLRTWLDQDLAGLNSDWNIEANPQEQVAALVADFASGEVLTHELQFRCIRLIGHGVWELKTPDVRIFGWFVARDQFIGAIADQASRVKKYALYAPYAREVARLREELDLDEPKFVSGDNPYDVVSDFRFPDATGRRPLH